MNITKCYQLCSTWRGGRIGTAQAFSAEGREFDSSESSQTNDLQNWHWSFPSQTLGIIKIEQGFWLAGCQEYVTEYDIRYQISELVAWSPSGAAL